MIPTSSISPLKNEIISSFPLQLSIYFNICLFPFHFITICISLYFKYDLLTLTYRVIIISALIVHLSAEAIRLGLGFYGNLSENMSALSGFLITSCIIQIPLTIFLILNTSYQKLPIEYLFFIFFFIFSVFEIIFAIGALKKTADREMKKFAHLIAQESVPNQ